jgi:hypothetical protein
VDRFNNPQLPPRLSWDGEHDVFQGGTFNGVRQQLDYLQQLGVGALWLSPVLKNCQYSASTYHGYGIQDFLSIDPRFASDVERAKTDPALVESELRALIDEAHARGAFGVPTFFLDDRAVFIRLMQRKTDPAEAGATLDRLLDVLTGWTELNELKATRIPR